MIAQIDLPHGSDLKGTETLDAMTATPWKK